MRGLKIKLGLILTLLVLASGAPAQSWDWQHTPEAEGIPFDPTGSDLLSTEVGPALRELDQSIDDQASPGFSWARSGNTPTNTWLSNGTVPSNQAGRIVPVDGEISDIYVANENINTFDISIYERTGAVFTLLATISVTATRTKTQHYTGISVDKGDELSARLTSGSAKNPVVGVVIKGASN